MVKNTIILLLLSFITFKVIGQSDEELVMVVEEAPLFKGDLELFIKDNIRYPLSAIKDSVEGTVYVEFYIDTTGLTFNHRVLRGVRDDLDNEALNVVRLLLFDSPAKQRGKPVVVRYLVPVRFVLDKNNIITNDSVEIVSVLDSWPSFDQDRKYDKLLHFIKDNLMQVDTLKKSEIVYVQFEVDTLGFTHRHIVLRGVNENLDAEALRVSKLIKFDNPAKQGGKPVCVIFILPIEFDPHKDVVFQKREFWKRKIK